MSNISDRFRSYRPELDTGWDIYGYLSHADFLNMRNQGAKWCQIYSSFAAIKHVQLMSISCQYVNPWLALVQPLARKGWRRPEPRDALGCRWAISAGMPRMKQGMRKEWNGEKREKSCWVEGGRAEQTWQGTGWCPPNLIVLQFFTMFYLSDGQIGQLNSWNHEKPLPLRDSPSPLRADPTPHAHWQGFEFQETLDVS